MKIAIDARIIASGTGRYIERLIHFLEQIDTTNEYLILVRKKDRHYYTPTASNFKIVEADFADYSFGEQIGFARLLYKLKPDLVHFCMPQQPLLYMRPSVTAVLDLNLLRIENNDMHPLELRIKKIIFGALLWIVSHRSKHILTISNYTKQDLIRFSHVKPEKITVTHLSADTINIPPQAIESLQNLQFLLYVGRAELYKNNRGLIEAHHELLTHYPDLHLVIAGKIDDLRISDQLWAEEHGYTKNLHFIGFVSNEELAWLYANTEAYVVPSLMEGFGLPGLEAMASGAPVVSSNTTCLPEILGSAAYYFDPTSIHDMTEAIHEVLNNRELRQKLIADGKKQVLLYSWQRMAEQVLAVYNRNTPKS